METQAGLSGPGVGRPLRLTGTVILDNGRLTAPRFKWTDVN